MAKVTATANGPFKVEDAAIYDADGNEVKEEGTHFLCRCGKSANKPFCDASHKAAGFEG